MYRNKLTACALVLLLVGCTHTDITDMNLAGYPAHPANYQPDYQKGFDALKKRDYGAAIKELVPLAKQGCADAQYLLAVMYDTGVISHARDIFADQNHEAAVIWYQRAAERGHTMSQINFGHMYTYGQGVPKDKILSYMWLGIGLANKDKIKDKIIAGKYSSEKESRLLKGIDRVSGIREDVAEEMTPAQIKKAQKRSHAFVEKKDKDC